MGLDQTVLTRVGSIFVAWVELGRVSHFWFGFGKFPLKIPNFSLFFPVRVKKYPGQRRVDLLFTADQKYARVRAHL